MWDDAVASFLAGGPAVPVNMVTWASCYQGTGEGAVEREAMPEPYLGSLRPGCAGVFLALNPGRADLAFQGRDGIFAREIQAMGSYSAWAASWPYLRPPWTDKHGPNRHPVSRLRFLHTWVNNADLDGSAMVYFELYPWHSTRLTARLRPDPNFIREYVWKPVAELKAPVFAFGAPWFPILEHGLGLDVVARLVSRNRN